MNGASTGLAGFIAAITPYVGEVSSDSLTVYYSVEAPLGALAGTQVMTGVNIDELQPWPAGPPHWVHLPAEVRFARTNINHETCRPGFVRHSRQVAGWADAADPAQGWLAHVRWVLGEALP